WSLWARLTGLLGATLTSTGQTSCRYGSRSPQSGGNKLPTIDRHTVTPRRTLLNHSCDFSDGCPPCRRAVDGIRTADQSALNRRERRGDRFALENGAVESGEEVQRRLVADGPQACDDGWSPAPHERPCHTDHAFAPIGPTGGGVTRAQHDELKMMEVEL